MIGVRLGRRLAVGGMAEVFVGEADIGGTPTTVAVKRMRPEHAVDPRYVDLFVAEARLAVQLRHPNIVRTFDVCVVDGAPTIVMELLDGLDLRRLHERSPLSVPQALYVASAALAGLHHAHALVGPDGAPLGVVHRDVSPQNLFLVRDGAVKLLDFGIAAGGGATESSVVKGKVRYMAPEQCLGQPVDLRADVYGVGAVLYELLTGQPPFRGRNAFEVMRAIVEEPLVPPQQLAPDLPPALDAVVARALARRPEDRFATAGDFRDALHRAARVSGLAPRSVADAVVAATGDVAVLVRADTATLSRVGGAQVLVLRGALDERFDAAAIGAALAGDVVVDSAGVTRVTSFGIRALLTLWAAARPRLGVVVHTRCSPAFLAQAGMARALLGGGSVVSFLLPYRERATGTPFTVSVAGDAARAAIARRTAPVAHPPWDPSAAVDLDDDEAWLLGLDAGVVVDPPEGLAAALRWLDGPPPLDVELAVDADRARLVVRRPLRAGERWARVVDALQGEVEVDFSEGGSGDAAACQPFADAMLEAEGVEGWTLVAAPWPLRAALVDIGVPVRWRSARADTTCAACGARTDAVVAPPDAWPPCPRCGGPSAPVTAAPPPPAAPPPEPPQPPEPGGFVRRLRAWLQGDGS